MIERRAVENDKNKTKRYKVANAVSIYKVLD